MKHRIHGSKGGKGGGGYRAPVEAANTLKATQSVGLVDVISEGEIVGLVDGAKGIFLNETPLMTAAGAYTYNDVSWTLRTGQPEQSALPYDAGATNEVGVGVEITHDYPKASGSGSGKYQFSVTNTLATRLQVSLGVNALYETLMDQEHVGDIIGASVNYKISVKNKNNAEIYSRSGTISGKTMSRYLQTVQLNLSDDGSKIGSGNYNGPWLVTVEKTTADSKSSTLQNDLYLSSYTVIVGYSFTFPYSALMSISASAESFGNSVPTRAYKVKGLKIAVPSNYDPTTRAYSGIWDGSFKTAWTDNPAWVFYDIVTNDRYGLARFLPSSIIDYGDLCDKWLLYEVARICDELVPDGFGGKEPRYTFNYQIMGAAEAKEVLQSIASCFHGMSYWCSGMIYARSDYPSDPIRTLTQTNIIKGQIDYATASIQDRHSVVLVTWNDPDDMYKATIETVFDWELYSQIGYRSVSSVAYGCTSRGQAHRHGLWILATEAEEWQCTVTVGIDGFDYLPGDVVRLADPTWQGYRASGRVKNIDGINVTLDAPFETAENEVYQLAIYNSAGTEDVRQVTDVKGSLIIVDSDYTGTYDENAVWSMRGALSSPRLFAIRNITEKQKGNIQLTLRETNPKKYLEIEQGIVLEKNPTRRAEKTLSAPTDVNAKETAAKINGTLTQKVLISWSPDANYGGAVAWQLSYTDPLGNTTTLPWQNTICVELVDIMGGLWTFRVIAKSSDGRVSLPTVREQIISSIGTPSNITGLQAAQDGDNIDLFWDANTDINFSHYEVRTGFTWSQGTVIANKLLEPYYSVKAVAEKTYGFSVKAVNIYGQYCDVAAVIQIAVRNLTQANIFVEWNEFSSVSGENSGTVFVLSPYNCSVMKGGCAEYEDDRCNQFGEGFLLTLADGATNGCWNSVVHDLLKVVNAQILADYYLSMPDKTKIAVEMRTSLDNVIWREWAAYTPRTVQFRYIQFRFVLTTGNVDMKPYVSYMNIIIDMPDIVKTGRIIVPASGAHIDYGFDFAVIPTVVLTADGAERQARIDGVPGLSGVDVKVFGTTGSAAEGVVNWSARGY